MKGLILTAKHHDGFVLWPSRFTEHSVKRSPWKNGEGDVVGELAQRLRGRGAEVRRLSLALGSQSRGLRPASVHRLLPQPAARAADQYGTVFEVWFDGANGGDGYYGGARETAKDRRRDLLRLGRTPGRSCAAAAERRDVQRRGPGYSLGRQRRGRRVRHVLESDRPRRDLSRRTRTTRGWPRARPSGTDWAPPEVDVSIRPGWFYHPAEDDKVKTRRHAGRDLRAVRRPRRQPAPEHPAGSPRIDSGHRRGAASRVRRARLQRLTGPISHATAAATSPGGARLRAAIRRDPTSTTAAIDVLGD